MYELGELGNQSTHARRAGGHHESILKTYLINYGWSSPTAEGILQNWKRENPRNGFLKWWVAKCSQFQLVSPLLDTYHRITPRKDQFSVMCHPVVILWKETVVNIEYYFQFDSQGYLRIRCCIQKSTQGWHLIPFSLIFLFVPLSLPGPRCDWERQWEEERQSTVAEKPSVVFLSLKFSYVWDIFFCWQFTVTENMPMIFVGLWDCEDPTKKRS